MNQDTNSIQDCINLIKKELSSIYSGNEIQSFIRLIFDHLQNYSAIDLIEKRDDKITPEIFEEVLRITTELKTQKPIQYILGFTEFYENRFIVNENVLIPRPETEELILWMEESEIQKESLIVDIGTGSGCIPISLKKIYPDAIIYAIDISKEALKIAYENSKLNKVKIEFVESDILNTSSIVNDIVFDVIVSNPPYVTVAEKTLMEKNVLDYEPNSALFVPNENPLIFYQSICDLSQKYLKPGGLIFFEINQYLVERMKNLLADSGFKNIEAKKDLVGNHRMMKAQKK